MERHLDAAGSDKLQFEFKHLSFYICSGWASRERMQDIMWLVVGNNCSNLSVGSKLHLHSNIRRARTNASKAFL